MPWCVQLDLSVPVLHTIAVKFDILGTGTFFDQICRAFFYFGGSQFGIFIHIPPTNLSHLLPVCEVTDWSIRRKQTVCIIMYITDLNFSVCLHHIKYMYMPTLTGQVSITSTLYFIGTMGTWFLINHYSDIHYCYILFIGLFFFVLLFLPLQREAKTCVGLLLCNII